MNAAARGPRLVEYWNAEQAELLLTLYRAGRAVAHEKYQSPALDALVAVGFVALMSGRLVLTEEGRHRAAELIRTLRRPIT